MGIVIALGGNALGKNLPEQMQAVKETSKAIADLIEAGHQVVIAHGNGPQVGMIQNAFAAYRKQEPSADVMPLSMCVAMSQGYIGYHLQQAMRESLARLGKKTPVVAIATQVLVDKGDPAFKNPTKPIGPFYSKEEADKLAREKGYTMKEDAGRGFRRVVPSPKPCRIVEVDAIKNLWDTTITIACGGGGVPVIEKDGAWQGIEGVIDKDLAASALAQELDADILLILTEVEQVAINFNKPNEQKLTAVTVAEMEKYIAEGHFAPGSMLPKAEAALAFVQSGKEKTAIISSLNQAARALAGEIGTRITL